MVSLIAPINIHEFTDNVQRDDVEYIVSGDGIFDTLMETATQHLKAQFEGNRFREEDYATAYVQIYQATLQAALQIWLQKGVAEAELKIKEKQLELLAKQTEAEVNKAALYRRQIEAFDEDYKHKILKIMMDAWSVGFSVAKDSFEANGIPATMQKTAIDDLYNDYIKKDFDDYKYKRDSEMLEN
jgi:hypothetical protein